MILLRAPDPERLLSEDVEYVDQRVAQPAWQLVLIVDNLLPGNDPAKAAIRARSLCVEQYQVRRRIDSRID